MSHSFLVNQKGRMQIKKKICPANKVFLFDIEHLLILLNSAKENHK